MANSALETSSVPYMHIYGHDDKAEEAGHSRQPQQVDDWPPGELRPREPTQTGPPEGLSGEEDEGGVQQREPADEDQW